MKKQSPENIRNKKITIRFSKIEIEKVCNKAKLTNQKLAQYCREISINGFVFEKASTTDLNDVRLLRNILLEYKTNFSRIGTFIKVSSPLLFKEIEATNILIKNLLNKYQL